MKIQVHRQSAYMRFELSQKNTRQRASFAKLISNKTSFCLNILPRTLLTYFGAFISTITQLELHQCDNMKQEDLNIVATTCTYISHLRLVGIQFRALHLDTFKNLTHLSLANIHNLAQPTIEMGHIGVCLESLDITNCISLFPNKATRRHNNSLAIHTTFPNLTRLELSSINITDHTIYTITQLTNLSILSVTHSNMHAKQLTKLHTSNITFLNISRNKMIHLNGNDNTILLPRYLQAIQLVDIDVNIEFIKQLLDKTTTKLTVNIMGSAIAEHCIHFGKILHNSPYITIITSHVYWLIRSKCFNLTDWVCNLGGPRITWKTQYLYN